MHPPAGKAREAHGATKPKNHWRPAKISAWSTSATFAKDSRCAAELWTMTSQSEVGGTQAGGTHSVLSCTQKGSSPEMAGSGELLLPLSMATTCASKRDANTPMTTNHRKNDSACSLVLAQVLGRQQGKNERMGPTEPGSAHGQTQNAKKKTKTGTH